MERDVALLHESRPTEPFSASPRLRVNQQLQFSRDAQSYTAQRLYASSNDAMPCSFFTGTNSCAT